MTRLLMVGAVAAYAATAFALPAAAQEKPQPPTILMQAPVNTGPVKMAKGLEAWNAFVPLLVGDERSGECRNLNIPTGPMITLSFPTARSYTQSISVMTDSTGSVVRYIETRKNEAGPVSAPAAARSMYQVDFAGKFVIASNHDKDGARGVRISLDEFKTVPQYTELMSKMQFVLEKCGP